MKRGRQRQSEAEGKKGYVELGETDLRRLPIGAVREFDLDGLRVRATRHHEDRWQVHSGTVDVERLAGLASRQCVKREGRG